MAADLRAFAASLGDRTALAGRVVHLEDIPARPAHYATLKSPLPPPLANAVGGSGVARLFSHQAAAMEVVRSGRDVVAATPTASGKSLIYTLPVLERLYQEPDAKALFLFPLKALEQDQLQALNNLAITAGLGPVAAVYDGDTPPGVRKRLREEPPPVIISNPDMVHAAVCAYPQAWERFLAGLRYIVIDEVHTYRGVFGMHVAQVLRRLLRLADQQGARPSFVLCSATIANPGEHAAALTGRDFAADQVISQSGAPSAGRLFGLINPSRAPSTTAARLLAGAVRAGLATICFTKSRMHTELIHSWVTKGNPDLRSLIAGYRAGFLPEERRQIERALASGSLAGVVSTSALEMGIDIGGLDVCILVGYPGSQIRTWQRGGRVGRAGRESAVFLVAQPDALDQYFVKHPRQLFDRPVEAAVLDPDNKAIVGRHLVCAAAEHPLELGEPHFDLRLHAETVRELVASGDLLEDAQGGRWFAARKRPQRFVDLRGAGETFAVLEPGGRVVGSLDGIRALKEGHPGAVYLHQTKSYLVQHLDLRAKRVVVRPQTIWYYTRPRSDKDTEILEETGRRPVANFLVRQGRLKVTEQVTGYERRRLTSQDPFGVYPLDLPATSFETHGLWIDVEAAVRHLVEGRGRHFMGSIHALEHAAIAMFPLFVLCDRDDVGGISIPLHPQTNKAAVFIYDGVAGGVGLAEKGFEVIEELLTRVEELLSTCDCEDGCPACVHSPKCGNGNKPLDKDGALLLVRALLGKEDLSDLTAPAPLIEIAAPEPEPAPTGALDYVVFDLETQRLAQEVGGWKNIHLMRVSVGVAYDSKSDRFLDYSERQVGRLIELLERARMVVGFNCLRFDYEVLSAYDPRDFRTLPTLDLMTDVQAALGHRLSLDALAGATLGAAKSADGFKAVRWWRKGQFDKLTAYCTKDVEITRDLFRYGQENGHLLYTRKDGNTLRVPVDWSWEALRERFA